MISKHRPSDPLSRLKKDQTRQSIANLRAGQHRKARREREWTRLYEEYGGPLEAEHTGELLAVSPSGQTPLAKTFYEAVKEASKKFGNGSYLYKVGDPFAGTAPAVRSVEAERRRVEHLIGEDVLRRSRP